MIYPLGVQAAGVSAMQSAVNPVPSGAPSPHLSMRDVSVIRGASVPTPAFAKIRTSEWNPPVGLAKPSNTRVNALAAASVEKVPAWVVGKGSPSTVQALSAQNNLVALANPLGPLMKAFAGAQFAEKRPASVEVEGKSSQLQVLPTLPRRTGKKYGELPSGVKCPRDYFGRALKGTPGADLIYLKFVVHPDLLLDPDGKPLPPPVAVYQLVGPVLNLLAKHLPEGLDIRLVTLNLKETSLPGEIGLDQLHEEGMLERANKILNADVRTCSDSGRPSFSAHKTLIIVPEVGARGTRDWLIAPRTVHGQVTPSTGLKDGAIGFATAISYPGTPSHELLHLFGVRHAAPDAVTKDGRPALMRPEPAGGGEQHGISARSEQQLADNLSDGRWVLG